MSEFARGSEWRKWDLHVHTPASFHWSGKSFQAMSESEVIKTVESIVAKINSSECAAFCFMDYWTFDGYLKVLEVAGAQDLKINKTLFPGMELRVEAPVDFRLNIHVLFSELTTKQSLADFRAKLEIGGPAPKPLSDDGLRSLASALDADKAKEHGFVGDYANDSSQLLKLGSMTAKITRESLRAAKALVGDDQCLVILPYDCSDGVAKLDWKRHSSDDAFFLQFADAFESRTPANVKLFLGIEDTANSHFIGNFIDAIGGSPKPVFSGSDAHKISDYGQSPNDRFTWIKADPTFLGLRQTLVEPSERTFIGKEPPQLHQVRSNSTKYVDRIQITKDAGAKTSEKWFDNDLCLNTGLVAIIGNKGSGKSALADIIGHLGNTRQYDSFSFLNKNKFRNRKNYKADKFSARIHWASGHSSSRSLDADFDPAAIETIKYIPQSYLEKVCNEQDVVESDAFERELEDAIFTHIRSEDRLGKSTLRELVAYRTSEVEKRIASLRAQLLDTLQQLITLERKTAPEYRNKIANELAAKTAEIGAHDKNKPAPVPKPDAAKDTSKDAELTTAITKNSDAISAAESKLKTAQGQLKKSKLRAAKIDQVGQQLGVLEAEVARHMPRLDSGLRSLGLTTENVVKITIDRRPLTLVADSCSDDISKAEAQLDAEVPGSAVSAVASLRDQQANLERQLTEPNRKYQEFLAAVGEWEARRAALVGAADEPGTREFLNERLTGISAIPTRIVELEASRDEQSAAIFADLVTVCGIYSEMYAPVQTFVQDNALSDSGFAVSFDVTVSEHSFEPGFFDLIARNKAGSFCGVKEGERRMARLLTAVDFNDAASVVQFARDVLDRLREDHRNLNHPSMEIDTQLRERKTRSDLYMYLFALEYLRPRYELKLNDKTLGELSPGERGTLLLLFYLLVDKDTRPLVIDQPEENLDNQTVFSVLVPAVTRAKQTRQIILVTHNPNIGVVCDAEQIVVANIDKTDKNRVDYVSGAIESPAINRALVDILEGTRPAFDNRDAKYQEPGK